MRLRTDDEAAADDVVALLGAGRFADALVPAALHAERLGVRPRSLTFLAEIVRRGGAALAADLPQPLPDPRRTHLVRPWLLAAAPPSSPAPAPPSPLSGSPSAPLAACASPPCAAGAPLLDPDLRLARWLDGVAAVMEARAAVAAS